MTRAIHVPLGIYVYTFCFSEPIVCILIAQTTLFTSHITIICFFAGCRTVSNNGSGSGLAPAQNILAVQVWFGFT